MSGRDPERGLFVVLEGPDGSGKSLQAGLLAERLRKRGLTVTHSREPGGTDLGEQVRHIVNDPGPTLRGPKADVLLYTAARAQHVDEVIEPALQRGEVVVCDRYYTSTMAYQGYGSGMDRDLLRRIQVWATGGLDPDLVVLLDVSPQTGLDRRAAGDADELTRWEDESRFDLAFHTRVREGYLEMAATDPERWVVIDGSAAVDAVAAEVGRAVDAAMPTPADSDAPGDGAS
ncbi:MAG: dTMP kinase [Candidatus Limnocylindrales bacterium]